MSRFNVFFIECTRRGKKKMNRNFYYNELMLKASTSDLSDFYKNKMIIDLVKDIANDFTDEFIIKQVLEFCEINQQTLDAYVFAYKKFKYYENLSAPEEVEVAVMK